MSAVSLLGGGGGGTLPRPMFIGSEAPGGVNPGANPNSPGGGLDPMLAMLLLERLSKRAETQGGGGGGLSQLMGGKGTGGGNPAALAAGAGPTGQSFAPNIAQP